MTRKIIIGLLVIVLFSTTGASCFNNTQTVKEKVTLTMWGVYDDASVYQPIIDTYEQLNTNITINYVKKDYATYEQETMNALAAGKGPDIWMIRNDWVAAQYDKLQPMTSGLFKKSESDTRTDIQIYEDTFPEIAAEDNIINNKIYGVPLSIDTLVVYYNKNHYSAKQGELYSSNNTADGQLFLTTPNNWEDFLKVSKMLTVKDASGNITRAGAALGTANNVNESYDILAALMLQNKTEMTSADDLTATFNLPISKDTGQNTYPGTEALNFYTSFADSTKENYMWNTSMPNSVEAFEQGKVSMIIDYGFLRNRLAQEAPNLNYAIGPLPQVPGDTTSTDYASYWVQTVTNNCKYPGAAWKFIKYLSDNAETYDSATNRPSAKKVSNLLLPETKQRAALGGNPLSYQPMTAAYWYKGIYPNQVNSAFYTMIEDVIVNKQPLQISIDKAASTVTNLYKLSAESNAQTTATASSTAKATATSTAK